MIVARSRRLHAFRAVEEFLRDAPSVADRLMTALGDVVQRVHRQGRRGQPSRIGRIDVHRDDGADRGQRRRHRDDFLELGRGRYDREPGAAIAER